VTALEVYNGSDGDLTKAYYAELEKRGPIGTVAVNLFRAQKCSARAKIYRGGIRGHGSYRGLAYDRKNWAMQNLCRVLLKHGAALGITFGWKEDPAQEYHNWVLYVDLPTGQVSFHAATHGEGPLYRGDWDGSHLSAERILEFCDLVASREMAAICPHGQVIGAQGGPAQSDIDSCNGENELIGLLAFYSACDCCDTLMHHSTIAHGYKVMKDGRTLCLPCLGGEKEEDIDE
jgi:hypothetical protein